MADLRQHLTMRDSSTSDETQANVGDDGLMGLWILEQADGRHLRSLMDCTHAEDRERVTSIAETALREGQSVDSEHRLHRKDGSTRWLRVRTVRLDSGRTIAMVSDPTARRLADATLQEAEERYRFAADAGCSALFFLRAKRDDNNAIVDFSVTDANQRACALLSRARHELIHHSLRGLSPELGGMEPFAQFVEVVESRAPYEATIRKGLGLVSAEWVHLQAKALGDGLAVSIRDVSTEKRLELQLARAQRLESVGRMATGIAHDFNNMLSAITGFSTIARDSLPFGTTARDDLEQALVAAERAAQLTRYLLTFASRQPLRPELVQVNQVLSTLKEILGRILGCDVELELELDSKVVGAWLDPGQLEQAVINLATNARDAMPQGGSLRIATRVISANSAQPAVGSLATDNEQLCIKVSDTGIGMTTDTCERVFEPFFTTKGASQGTGLGLAMLYGFVRQSGGTITLESTVGDGTTFFIYLPHCRGAKSVEPQPSPSISGPIARGHETVLIVDCDESVRRVARRILELYGYLVLEAANAGEAYFLLASTKHDIELLLMSPQLQRIDAVEFATRAKCHRPRLAVVAMSGAIEAGLIEAFVGATQAQFIPKPLTPERLIDAVQQALSRRVMGSVCATSETS